MKFYLIVVLLFGQVFSLFGQEMKKKKYFESIVNIVKEDDRPIFFSLKVKKSSGKIYKITLTNFDLYYTKFSHLNYSTEFSDTLKNILLREILEEKDFPSFSNFKVNRRFYKKILKKGYSPRDVYNKYFDKVNFSDGTEMGVFKYDAYSYKELSAVIAYMSEHYIRIRSDEDGKLCIYVFNLQE
jgi:DNA mismatch repair ATPase MutS